MNSPLESNFVSIGPASSVCTRLDGAQMDSTISVEKLRSRLLKVREEQKETQENLENYNHSIQVNIQGILIDAELLAVYVDQGRHADAVALGQSIIAKLLHLTLTANNIRPNLGAFALQKTRIDELLEEAIDVFRSFAQDKGIDIVFRNQFGDGEPTVPVSRSHLQHALHNIIHNAIKYSYSRQSRRRTVDVVLRPQSKHFLLIKVQNYGVPIDPDEIPLVVKSGFRGRHSKERFRSGSGQGLFHTHATVRRHKGRMEISSTPVKGGAAVTVVEVYLPRGTSGVSL